MCLKKTKLSNSHTAFSVHVWLQIHFIHVFCVLVPKKHRMNKVVSRCLHLWKKNFVKFLAGPDRKKTMKLTEVASGLIYDFQEAVKKKSSVKFTTDHYESLACSDIYCIPCIDNLDRRAKTKKNRGRDRRKNNN